MLYYHPIYSALALPKHHRFPISKYQKLYQRLNNNKFAEHIKQPEQKITRDALLLCHDSGYVDAFLAGTLSDKAIKRMGFPWSRQLVERTLISLGGSLAAAEYALTHGIAANLSGGYHHAHREFGSGFCIFNDWVVVAATLIAQHQAEKVLIFDCDVHQGDGTAALAKGRDDIVTCSIHCESNFPRIKPNSDLDFALPVGTEDKQYLETVQEAITLATRIHQPDIILYNAGADIYQGDELGHFNISLEGVYTRDSIVIDCAVTQNIPLAIALGGGYQRNIDQLIDVHQQTFLALLGNPAIMI
ncbi:histone deacetylase [Pseudoalteromonas sp. McH1-7]|uniref:histone deacetylase family protein n=1 Tax=Pseudoalteromonas TaxID=53246 RepID=UPI000FFF07C8|nr:MULTISPECIES: histone deacetylase [Pseudoalteromonas]MDW7547750.1 histone deacetylase [Pseudoalteromonas peptidolytica]NUZ11312.1 histone deacetylase [Pseudoalteromonas sp. McH1-7]RXF03900.1 histone deacetylase [Pseudoalteromonas sp. PS5]USD27630.1 histone deacetylase [Pseudoalteromonas sp. SCSIO 43201]